MINRIYFILILYLSFTTTLFCFEEKIGYCTGDDVNVRDGYGESYKNYKVIYQLDRNDKVQIFDEKDGWYKIRSFKHNDIKNDNQWVVSSFISISEYDKPTNTPVESSPNNSDSSENSKGELADLELLWSMPSSFLGKTVNCYFTIHEVTENDDHYSIMVGDGNSLFDMKNPIQFDVRISKGDNKFVENIVKLKGKKAILSGIVMKTSEPFSIYYLNIQKAKYQELE